MNSGRDLALRIARLEAAARDKSPQLAYSAIEGGAITEFDPMGNVVASYGTQFDGSHIAMSYVGITPLKPTSAVVTPGPGELTIEWLGTWVDNGICPTDFTRVEVHISEVSGDAADTAATLYDTIETPRGAVVSVRLPAGVTYYVRLVARNLAGQRGPASDEIAGIPEAIVDQAALDAIQTQVDAIPADIAAAKQEAIDAAALTSQDQADLAQANAIATASADASTKANQAEADAIAAAAADASAKASAAQQAAIDSAALTAQQKADLAEADAIAASIPRQVGAVTETYIASDAVTTPKILAGAITTAKLDALAVTADKIAANAIIAGKIAADAVTSSTILAGAITAGKLAAASVIAGNIAADAVTATTIVAGAISTDKLAANAVTADKILAGAVIAGKLAADAVLANNIKAGEIGVRHLVVADLANMAWINESQEGVIANHTIVTDGASVRWSTRVDNSVTYLWRNLAGPIPFKEGDRLRVTFSAYTLAGTNSATPRIRYTDGTGWNLTAVAPSPTTITTSPQDFVYEGVVPAGMGANTSYSLGFASSAGVDIRVRAARGYRMGAGELIVDGTVFASKIATDAVTAVKILAGAVTTAKLDALAVTADKIAANAIIADKIAAGAITAGKLAVGAVIAGNIDAGAVTATTIAADALNGKVITGSTIQTAVAGPRVVIKPTPLNGDAGKVEWWDDHDITTLTYDAPPGINGLVNEYTGTDERYSLFLTSGVLHKADNLGGGSSIQLESRRTDGDPSKIWLEADRVFSMGVYNSTSTFTANVGIGTGIPLGRFYRLTSSERYKVGMKPESISSDAILKLVPKSYIDRQQWEDNGQKAAGLQRYLGLIAEEVAAIPELAPHLVTMNEDGQPEAVSYDRVGVVLIPVIQDLVRRVLALEGRPLAPSPGR